MSITDYSNDILLVNQAIERLRMAITHDEFNAMIRAMDLIFILDLLKKLDCPIDELIENFIRANFNFDKLQDIDGKYILPLLSILGYEVIKGDDIPDNKGMWKVGFKKGDKEWVKYSDELEPYGVFREIFIELLRDYYANQPLG